MKRFDPEINYELSFFAAENQRIKSHGPGVVAGSRGVYLLISYEDDVNFLQIIISPPRMT